jgi:hypothetical protein
MTAVAFLSTVALAKVEAKAGCGKNCSIRAIRSLKFPLHLFPLFGLKTYTLLSFPKKRVHVHLFVIEDAIFATIAV